MNKSPIGAIARIAELSPKAVYDKIDFIHRQCLAFVGARERDLWRLDLRRLYVSTDRQDYVVNWTDRKKRANVQLTVVGPRSQLPRKGAQVRFEYTVYAHYRLLRRLIGHAGKIRFFMDEDGALLAGFTTAFANRIRADEVQGASVSIDKSLTVDERRALVKDSKRLIEDCRAQHMQQLTISAG